jgi:hypothetical protein
MSMSTGDKSYHNADPSQGIIIITLPEDKGTPGKGSPFIFFKERWLDCLSLSWP